MFEECTSGQMKSCCPFHFRAPQHTMSHTPMPYKERRERFILCMLCCTSIIRQLRRGDSPRKNPQQPLHHALGIKCPTSIFGLSIRLMHLSIVQAYYFGGDFTCRELETFSLTTNSCFESIKEIFKY